jgi:hypothetical protein
MRQKVVGNHSSKSSAKALQVQDTGEETPSERQKSSVSTLGALGIFTTMDSLSFKI